ncbi:polyprenyl diphosphate synthase [Streptomyces sp. NPDC059003]|uniref:polyprenyl diphosphate synthase n=1 Tax=Streptomyces sp. NPDC059003 TaxID=3346691 RepID=UPI0036C3CF3D
MGAGRAVAPEHVAVILDGNRRWAQEHGRPVVEGYRRGAQRVGDLLGWCEERGVGHVTVWVLSLDNLRRSREDVTALLEVITTGLRELADLGQWRIRPIGALDVLPSRWRDLLAGIEADTSGFEGLVVNVAIAYDGRQEIVDAVRALVSRVADGAAGESADEQGLARYMYTAGQPDLDLVIRTSGEQRLSGFMTWQAAYAEYYFASVCWPDFSRADFDRALLSYARRQRRRGL